MNPEPLIVWQTHEYEHTHRTPDWYWTIGVVGIAGAIVSIYFKNTLFGIFLLVAVVCVFIFAFRKPKVIEVKLYEKGLRLDNFFYPFENIKQFYVSLEEDRLYFITDKVVLPVFRIYLEDADPEYVHAVFTEAGIPEQKMSESMADKVIDKLGF